MPKRHAWVDLHGPVELQDTTFATATRALRYSMVFPRSSAIAYEGRIPVRRTVERPDLETAEGQSTFTRERGAINAAVLSARSAPLTQDCGVGRAKLTCWQASALDVERSRSPLLDWSLLSGPIPVVLRVSAVLAALWLLSRTLRARRQLWTKWVDLTACLLVAAVVTAVVAYLARNVWMLYPDNLDPAVYLWAGAGVLAVTLTVTRVVTERKLGRALVGLTTAVVIVVACANQVNAIYGAYVTPRDALHMVHPDDIALRDAPSDPGSCPTPIRWSRAGPRHRVNVAGQTHIRADRGTTVRFHRA